MGETGSFRFPSRGKWRLRRRIIFWNDHSARDACANAPATRQGPQSPYNRCGPFSIVAAILPPPLRVAAQKQVTALPAKQTRTAQAQIAACRWMRFAPSAATGTRSGCGLAAGRVYHAACERKAHAIILRSHAPLRLAHRLPLDIERLLAGFQAFGFKGVLGSVAVASVANGFRCSIRVHNGRTTTSRK